MARVEENKESGVIEAKRIYKNKDNSLDAFNEYEENDKYKMPIELSDWATGGLTNSWLEQLGWKEKWDGLRVEC